MEKTNKYYVIKESHDSIKLFGLLCLLKSYNDALYMNRQEHLNFCKDEALKEAYKDVDNFDFKKFNQTIKNKQNKIDNGVTRFDALYKRLIKDYNAHTMMTEELNDALIDRFDEFYNENIELKNEVLTIK